MHLLRSLLLLVIPGILFSAALFLQLKVVVPQAWQPLLMLFPYLAVGAGLFLGWRFNRTRVLWVILFLAMIERGLVLSTPFGKEFLLVVAPIFVPLNLALFSWWDERGLLTVHGLLRLMVILAQAGFVLWLYISRAGDTMAWLGRPLLDNQWLERMPFSQIALMVIVISMIVLCVRFYLKPEALEGAFCWVLPAAVAGLLWADAFTFWAGVAVAIFVVALIESSFKMAFNDELTGLPARRAMNEFLLKVGRRYTVAMVDVDHFKKVNDNHGHDVGDQVLRMVATCLRRVSGGGRAYRYGGEEFAVIFPSKDLKRALPHLEELREKIASSSFVVRGKKRPKKTPQTPERKTVGQKSLQVTVSVGAAERDEKNSTPQQLIKAADRALYKAKKAGRNQVCC